MCNVTEAYELIYSFKSSFGLKGKVSKGSHSYLQRKIKRHIESQFDDGMCWGNHGEWEICCLIPVNSINSEFEAITINNYRSLQPVWKNDNKESINFNY